MFDKGPSGKPVNVFCKARKDGKFRAEFCFHAKRLTKILTAEQLDVVREDPFYCVQRSGR